MMDTADQNDTKFSVFNQASTPTTFDKHPNPFLNLLNYESKTTTRTTVDDLIQFNDPDKVNPWSSSLNLPTIVEQEDLNNNNVKMGSEVSEQLSQLEQFKTSLFSSVQSSVQPKKNDYAPMSNIGGTWGEKESPSKAMKTWDSFGTTNFDFQRKQPISKYWKSSESDEQEFRAVGGLLPTSNNIWSNVTTHDVPWPKDKNLFPNSDLHEGTQAQKLDSSVELIRSTKEYRILIGKGFNREDVETALRKSFLNFDVAYESLMSQQSQQFQKSSNNNNSTFVNRMVGQPLHHLPLPVMQQQVQPSAEQLNVIVQQVQLAVQAGYLNCQILNQPLAPQTLVLMNQLLIQIRDVKKSELYLARGGQNSYQLSINMEKTKQLIHNIQLDIVYQQDLYVKQLFNATNHLLQRRQSPPMEQSHGFCNQNGARAVTNYWKSNIPGEYLRPTGPIQSVGSVSSFSYKQQTPLYDDWQQKASSTVHKPSLTPPFSSIVETAPEFQPGKPWKGCSSVSTTTTFKCQTKDEDTQSNFLTLSSSTWSYNPGAGLGLPSNGSTSINTEGIKWNNEEFGQSDAWGVNTNPADTNWAQ